MNTENNGPSNENEDSLKSEVDKEGVMNNNETDDKLKVGLDIPDTAVVTGLEHADSVNNDISPKEKEIEEQQEEIKKKKPTKKEEQTYTIGQYIISLMKAILGTGSLALPFAVQKIGIVPTIILYVIFALWNCYSSWQLSKLNVYMNLHPNLLKGMNSPSAFGRLAYAVLGKVGYGCFLFCFLLTLFGFQIGILIVMVQFSDVVFNFFWPNVNNSHLYVHLFITVILGVALLLSNIKVVVFLSSFGLFALALSFIILFIYGFANFPFAIPSSLWFPESASGFFSHLGIIVFSLAYMPVFLSLFTRIHPSKVDKGMKATHFAVDVVTLMYLILGIGLCGLFINSESGVKDVILNNLPGDAVYTVIVNLCMDITLLGNFPVYYMSIAEVLETKYGPMTQNSAFITHPQYICIRLGLLVVFSLIGYFFPSFSDILSLYILLYIIIIICGFCNVAISFILPPLIYYVVFKSKSTALMNTFNVICFVIGFILMCVCTYYNFVSLIS
ncbi:hypothetical protein WA158_006736 [Blastocystis sp. Blastoise]